MRLVPFRGGDTWATFQMRTNAVDRVSDKNRLDEAHFVIAVAERVDIVVRHQDGAQTENRGAGNQPAAKRAFFFGEDVIGNVRVHVKNQGVERHALAF
jgi:hypothetical protein